MIWVALVSSLVHPAIFVVVLLTVALSVIAGEFELGRVVACLTLVGAPVLTAGVTARAFHQWCFGELGRGHRSVPLLASVWTGSVLLGNTLFLAATRAVWERASMPVASLLIILSQATTCAIVIAAVLMCVVLLVELPLRWATSAFGRTEAHRLLSGMRWVGVTAGLSVAWYLIVEFSNLKLIAAVNALSG